MKLKITLPLPDNFSNSRAHWRAKLKAKKQYWADCDLLRTIKAVPRPPKKPWDKSRITVKFFVWSPMDQSNLMARMKWPEDWLVNSGYIVDDAPKHLEYTGVPTQKVERKHQRVEITLEKMS